MSACFVEVISLKFDLHYAPWTFRNCVFHEDSQSSMFDAQTLSNKDKIMMSHL